MSFTLSFGSSQRTVPRSSWRSFAGSQLGSSLRSVASSLGASRSFVSVSPSSGFVFTQHWPGALGSEPRSSSRSAGKLSRARTRTTSPTRTCFHALGSKASRAPRSVDSSIAASTSTTSLFDAASARWRARSSFALKYSSHKQMKVSVSHEEGWRLVSDAGLICIRPTRKK